ncbi:MAG: glycosyltransferase family 87 protein [Candidatus Dormibacteria bacterium]|jgi:hypothetical protein
MVTAAVLVAYAATQALRGLITVGNGSENDFSAFASASRMLAQGSQCLYCAGPLRAAESAYLGAPQPAVDPFQNPPVAALVLTPLAELPRTLGFALFIVISMLAIGLGAWLLVTRLGCPPWATILAALALPTAWITAEGQWDALLFLALVAAIVLLERHPVLAGLLLSVLAIKVQTVWLVPVVLVALGRWRVLLGMGIGAALFAASTVALLGPHWMDWPRTLIVKGSEQESGSIGLPGIVASVWGSAAGFLGFGIAAVLAAVASWGLRGRLRDDPILAVAAAVSLSLLLAPHVFATDLLLLAPALALAGRRLPVFAAVAALLLSVAYVVGTLPLLVIDVNAYTAALVVIAVVVLSVVLRRPPGRRAGLTPAS